MDYTNFAGRPTLKVRHTACTANALILCLQLVLSHSATTILTHAPQRSYNNMAQAGAPPPFLDFSGASRAPHDEHYHNHEHQPQRRRIEQPMYQRPAHHFPGDGFDYRRPIMSAPSTADTIDLTGDRHEHSTPQHHLALPGAPDATAGTSTNATRAQRPPRFSRDIIDLADSDGEGQQHQPAQRPTHRQELAGNPFMPGRGELFMPQMEPDDDSLFLPEAPPSRPTTAGLRRPGYARRPTSPMDFDGVEIVSSRPLSRNPSRRPTPAILMRGPTAAPNPPPNGSATIDLTADDDDEVIHTNTRPLPSINAERPAMAGSGIGTRDRPGGGDLGIGRLVQHIRGQGARYDQALNHLAERAHRPGNHEDPMTRALAARRRADRAHAYTMEVEEQVRRVHERRAREQMGGQGRAPRPVVAIPDIMMNYEIAGFDMGFGVVQPATPKYEPPPPAAKGFTRSPTEDEEVVCPNCGDELAVAKDEMKQQVWVVKACGHVSEALLLKQIRRDLKANICSGILWRMCHSQPSDQQRQRQSSGPQHPTSAQEVCGGWLREACR
jgi:hypothetical protein